MVQQNVSSDRIHIFLRSFQLFWPRNLHRRPTHCTINFHSTKFSIHSALPSFSSFCLIWIFVSSFTVAARSTETEEEKKCVFAAVNCVNGEHCRTQWDSVPTAPEIQPICIRSADVGYLNSLNGTTWTWCKCYGEQILTWWCGTKRRRWREKKIYDIIGSVMYEHYVNRAVHGGEPHIEFA